MVTNTRNLCSAFNPSKVHTHSSEHTLHEHTPGAVGSHLCCGTRGAVGGSVLAQGHLSRGIEGGESAGHSLPPPTIPAGPETRTCHGAHTRRMQEQAYEDVNSNNSL